MYGFQLVNVMYNDFLIYIKLFPLQFAHILIVYSSTGYCHKTELTSDIMMGLLDDLVAVAVCQSSANI